MTIDTRFILSIVSLQAVVTVAVAFDMGVFRQALVFCYLLFVPGIVLKRLLRIDDANLPETLAFSVALSITFLFLLGLFVNALLPLMGFKEPLSSFSILLFVNISILLISLVRSPTQQLNQKFLKSLFSTRNLVIVFPILGILGSILSAYYQNSAVLLLLIVLIAISIILAVYRKVFSHPSYPVLFLTITLALVFMGFFSTRFASSFDETFEFYSFRITQIDHYWNPSYLPSGGLQLWKTHSMLSVNMLPSMIIETSGIDNESLYKLLYLFVVSFIPVVAYKFFRTQFTREVSFMATTFLLVNCIGQGWGNAMQHVAQLFYVFLLFMLFREGTSRVSKTVLFGLFAFSLVVSHYSMAIIFAITLLLCWLLLTITRTVSPKITLTHVLLVFILLFSWYVYISQGATFQAIQESASLVMNSISSKFLDINARGSSIVQFFGFSQTASSTIFHQASKFVFQISAFLIVLGFINMLHNRSKIRFAKEFQAFVFLNLTIILLNIALPNLSGTLLMQRFYQTTLIVLSPMFVLGGYLIFDVLGKKFSRVKTEKLARLFLLSILILLLLFQSGFVYELARVQCWSIPLSGYRIDKVTLYEGLGVNNAFDVYGATWLGSVRRNQGQYVYSDDNARDGPLLSYGLIKSQFIIIFSNTTTAPLAESYIFLGWVNTVAGEVVSSTLIWNTLDAENTLNAQNVIYSNGGSIVYKVP